MGLILEVDVFCLSMCSALMFMGVKLLILFVILGIFLFGEN